MTMTVTVYPFRGFASMGMTMAITLYVGDERGGLAQFILGFPDAWSKGVVGSGALDPLTF